MRDGEDTDRGTGSTDLEEAKALARKYRAQGDTDAYVVVVEDGDDPVAVDEIHDPGD